MTKDLRIVSGTLAVHAAGDGDRTLCGRAWTEQEPPNVGSKRMWGRPTQRPVTCGHCRSRSAT